MKRVGEEVKGVGVIKDEELMLEEIEASHTLGGCRRLRCYSAVRYTVVRLHECSFYTFPWPSTFFILF